MSEWLTTGEMIDQLKDGETAKSTDGEYEAYWHHGLLKFIDKRGDVQERIIKSDQERRWQIIPKFVKFEEALKAYQDGKTIVLHLGDKKYKYSKSLVEEPFILHIFVNGYWTIED